MRRWKDSAEEISWFSLFLIIFSGIFVFWCYAYPPSVRIVPLLVGWPMLGLSLADCVWRLRRKPPKAASGQSRGGARSVSAAAAPQPVLPLGRAQLVAIGWLAGLVAGTYLIGFLATSFPYVALSLSLRGEKSWRYATITAALVTTGIWVVFSQLLHYELFLGILLEDFF